MTLRRNGYIRKRFYLLTGALLLVTVQTAQSQVRIAVSQGRLDTVCGTHAVKLVFTNQNYLWYIDFSETVPQAHLINVSGAYYPVISTDGRWIAYQTGIEREGPPDNAVKGKAWFRDLATSGTAIQVADTAYVPRFVQKTSADTPEIVYAKSVQCPAGICYNAGGTMKKKIVNRVPQPEQTVFAGGSYYGGLSYDNRYLATGWPAGPNAFMLDLQHTTGPAAVHTMHVKKNATNADTAVEVGTCNISRSASRIFTNTMLFYDFGSDAITAANCHHPILGTWAEHAKLFISRYDAADLKVFDMPADRLVVTGSKAKSGDAVNKEWFNPEWSNHPYYAVAALRIDRIFDSSGNWIHRYNNESVYLINLKDSTYMKLIESSDTSMTSTVSFGYPWVWVDTGTGFREDNAWLSKTIWERTGVNHSYEAGKPADLRTVLLHGEDLRSIIVYTISGRRVGFLQPVPTGQVIPGTVFRALPKGMYLLSIATRSNATMLKRWSKAK